MTSILSPGPPHSGSSGTSPAQSAPALDAAAGAGDYDRKFVEQVISERLSIP
jgi:hypothetical protein